MVKVSRMPPEAVRLDAHLGGASRLAQGRSRLLEVLDGLPEDRGDGDGAARPA